MADTVEVKGARELQLKLDKTAQAIVRNGRLMAQIGELVSTRIKQRTAKGIGADLKKFPPYSPSYKRWRSEKMKRPVKWVDLFLTGSMFAALTHSARNDHVSVYFMDTVDRFGGRNPQKAFFNQETRNFFAMNANDVAEIEKMVRYYLALRLKDKT
jgi:phage gpG-like protein